MRKVLIILGVVAAALAHAAILLFGGLLFQTLTPKEKKVQPVELLTDGEVQADKKEEKKEEKPETPEEIKPQQEAPPPDSTEVVKQAGNPEPALEAASLSAIESALSGAAGDQSFGGALSFASGGKIGGTGKAGGAAGKGGQAQTDSAFSMADIDQKPRAIFQVAPSYPSELRAKKTVGEVLLLLVVNASGRVDSVRVEKSSHPAFAKPAMDAVRQWKFDPAIRGGKKVACKMRLPIKFSVG